MRSCRRRPTRLGCGTTGVGLGLGYAGGRMRVRNRRLVHRATGLFDAAGPPVPPPPPPPPPPPAPAHPAQIAGLPRIIAMMMESAANRCARIVVEFPPIITACADIGADIQMQDFLPAAILGILALGAGFSAARPDSARALAPAACESLTSMTLANG